MLVISFALAAEKLSRIWFQLQRASTSTNESQKYVRKKETVMKNFYVILLQPTACNFTKKESVKYQRRIYDALKIYDRAFL